LYAVRDIGGWCCVPCRNSKVTTRSTAAQKKKITPMDVITEDIQGIKQQLQGVFQIITNAPLLRPNVISNDALSPWLTAPNPNAVGNPETYADVVRINHSREANEVTIKSNPSILAMVHAELNSVRNRANCIVVTGLPEHRSCTDHSQIEELITTELNIKPDIIDIRRIGQTPLTGTKPRPIIVTLDTASAADCIVAIAKDLRHSNNVFTKEHVFINKFLTKAESEAAFNERQKRRQNKLDHIGPRPLTQHINQQTRIRQISSPPSSSTVLKSTNYQDGSYNNNTASADNC